MFFDGQNDVHKKYIDTTSRTTPKEFPLYYCNCKRGFYFKGDTKNCAACVDRCEKCSGPAFADCIQNVANSTVNGTNDGYVCSAGFTWDAPTKSCNLTTTTNACANKIGWYQRGTDVNPNFDATQCVGCPDTCWKCPAKCHTCEYDAGLTEKVKCVSCPDTDPEG